MKKLFTILAICTKANFTNAQNSNDKDVEPFKKVSNGKDSIQYYIYRNVKILTPAIGIPALRVDMIKSGSKDAKVKISAFNSISIGLNLNMGRVISKSKDWDFQKEDKMTGVTGIGGGVLFAVDGKNNSGNVFAPYLSFNVLNIQLFYGYDLGNVTADLSRSFIGLSTGFSLSSLFDSDLNLIINSSKNRKGGGFKKRSTHL